GSKTSQSPVVFPVTPSVTASYSVLSIQDSAGCAFNNPPGSALVTVNTAPAVTVNPGNQVVLGSGSAVFTAAASGSPAPGVQWQVSTDGGATFVNIPGATAATLSFTPTALQSGSRYRAVFTNPCGSATTAAAILIIYDTCLKDASGNIFQFNSKTGEYR